MSADDSVFLDILSAVPNDIWMYSNQVREYVDKHLERASQTLDKASDVLRDAINGARYQKPPPPPPRAFTNPTSGSVGSQILNWVSKHKVSTAICLFSVGGIVYMVMTDKRYRKKRRAKKASNGARLEVVVLAGSPSEPITRSISLDLERRGFIVYIVCNTIEEEVIVVESMSRPDIKPLMIDIVDPESARASIERFTEYLQKPHAPFQGTRLHHLQFRSLILIPSLTYPSSPIATLSPSTLNDLLNTRVLTPILTLQTFLPLLTSLPLSHPYLNPGPPPTTPKPSVLVLTPTIIPSLSPAFHAPESTLVAALTSFTSVLSAELSVLDIPVTHLKLGTFDFSSFSPRDRHLTTLQSQRAETLKWDPHTRETFGKNFVSLTSKGAGRGSSLRELNDAVFDAMVSRRGGTRRVGSGSRLYGFVGAWVPSGLVGWMMGLRKVGEEKEPEGKYSGKGLIMGSEEGSRSTSPESPRAGFGGSEYVSVYREKEFSERELSEGLRD